jgi:cobaltochelatase CobN
MHLVADQVRSLDETARAVDLAQTPGEVAFLSFSDSDLGLVASLAEERGDRLPSLRLASLADLRHPYSIDLWLEQVGRHAKFILVRLLGGMDWWRYGVDELSVAARNRGITLAIVPGDHRADDRLDAASTLPVDDLRRLWSWFQEGGPDNVGSCLSWIATRLGRPATWDEPRALPAHGEFVAARRETGGPLALITLYRSIWAAADTAPITALADALAARGLSVRAEWVTSLKDGRVVDGLSRLIEETKPAIVVNTTAFSARLDDGTAVLDRAGVPVLQAVLATSEREAWTASSRGLGASDLAMNVVLPEVDGRIATRAISFKGRSERSATLEHARARHVPDEAGIAAVADLAAAWVRLAATPRETRRLAMIVSNYPAKGGHTAYAVGLDTPASIVAIAEDLAAAGYAVTPPPGAGEIMAMLEGRSVASKTLGSTSVRDASRRAFGAPQDEAPENAAAKQTPHAEEAAAGRRLEASRTTSCSARPNEAVPARGEKEKPAASLCQTTPALPLAAYEALFATLPETFRTSVLAAWGHPAEDPALVDGAFPFATLDLGNLLVAVQPDRGLAADRKDAYHDAARPPRHAYVAFYLWLREAARIDAMIHLGTHGTLEWLPGKAAAPAPDCAPTLLLGATPVVYPFVVNNPGEAAQAKRRLSAIALGHMTPPLTKAGSHGAAAEIEALLDEFSQAQTLDARRARMLAETILERARETGLASESGIAPEMDAAEALTRLDAWLCDLKDARISDGLHVFARPPSPALRETAAATLGEDADAATRASLAAALEACAGAERDGLIAALDGRFVAPGTAGAPSRGRLDVLPTGRNLYAVDPRAVPTRTAWEIGRRTAEEVVARHAQEHGDWPRAIVLDLWGSATMRTGGDDLAQAFALMGCRPTWDPATARVTGFEILVPAKLGRPRVDVTLRISGLFRDVFERQIALFDEAVRAVAALDEDDDDNPLAAASRSAEDETAFYRVFGAAPGAYGVGIATTVATGAWATRADLAEAYVAASSHAFGRETDGVEAREAFVDRLASVDAFVHSQDSAEQDVLDADAYAEHEGGFAAAAEAAGNRPALWHVDTTRPDATRVRTLSEEIARVVRARATNPRWITGQMRHGHRGAAEIAETVGNLLAFAATTDAVAPRAFDLLFDATLGDERVSAFMREANPRAANAAARAFDEALRRGLWASRRNSVAGRLAEILEADR